MLDGRRISEYFVPIPRAKKKNPKQLSFETEWTADRLQENQFINQVRERVSTWRQGGYLGITRISARLLEYWQRPGRERRLFFCQVEAMETAIYLAEVAGKYGDAWMENAIQRANAEANPMLYRIAFKMATGSGKTLVMAMLIAWQTLNKIASQQDVRFSDTFLVVAPGITIKDRLRVLMPNDPQNYYHQHDLVPAEMLIDLGKAKMVITNFHVFKQREKLAAGKITKDILSSNDLSRYTVTIKGLYVYDPTTGEIRFNKTDDIACWLIDTDYNKECFVVWHAYFTGADEPCEKLKRALRAEIDEAAWSTLYQATSYPIENPKSGKIAVKVINHYGDEVLKVFEI